MMNIASITILLVVICHFTVIAGNLWNDNETESHNSNQQSQKRGKKSDFDRSPYGMRDDSELNDRTRYEFDQPEYSPPGIQYLDKSDDKSGIEPTGQHFVGNPFDDRSNDRTGYDFEPPKRPYPDRTELPGQNYVGNPFVDGSNDKTGLLSFLLDQQKRCPTNKPYLDRFNDRDRIERPADNFVDNLYVDRSKDRPGYEVEPPRGGFAGDPYLDRSDDRRGVIELPGQNSVEIPFVDRPNARPKYEFETPVGGSAENTYLDGFNDISRTELPGQNFVGNPLVDKSDDRTGYESEPPRQDFAVNPHPDRFKPIKSRTAVLPIQNSLGNPFATRPIEIQNSISNPYFDKAEHQNCLCKLPFVHPIEQPGQSPTENQNHDISNDRGKIPQPGQNFIGNPFGGRLNLNTRYDTEQPGQISVSNPSGQPGQSYIGNSYFERSNDRSKTKRMGQNSASNPSERLKQSPTRNPYLAKLNPRRHDNSDDEKKTKLHDSKKKPNLNKTKDGKKPIAATRQLSFDSGPDNYEGIEYFVSLGKIYGCQGDMSTVTDRCMGKYIPATPIKENEFCQQKVIATIDNMICVSNGDVKILTYNGKMFCKSTHDQDTLVIDSAEYSRICSQLFG